MADESLSAALVRSFAIQSTAVFSRPHRMYDSDDDALDDDSYDKDDDAYDDDDSDDLITCLHCGATIYEDSVACAVCGEYLTSNTHPLAGRPWWFLLLGALGIVALLASLILI